MKNPEIKYVSNPIRLWCGEHNMLCFHINVFKGLLANGQYVQSGVPNGFPDLTIINSKGVVFFCETKYGKGKLRQDQIDFIKVLRNRNCYVCVAYSLDEFIEFVNKNHLN